MITFQVALTFSTIQQCVHLFLDWAFFSPFLCGLNRSVSSDDIKVESLTTVSNTVLRQTNFQCIPGCAQLNGREVHCFWFTYLHLKTKFP